MDLNNNEPKPIDTITNSGKQYQSNLHQPSSSIPDDNQSTVSQPPTSQIVEPSTTIESSAKIPDTNANNILPDTNSVSSVPQDNIEGVQSNTTPVVTDPQDDVNQFPPVRNSAPNTTPSPALPYVDNTEQNADTSASQQLNTPPPTYVSPIDPHNGSSHKTLFLILILLGVLIILILGAIFVWPKVNVGSIFGKPETTGSIPEPTETITTTPPETTSPDVSVTTTPSPSTSASASTSTKYVKPKTSPSVSTSTVPTETTTTTPENPPPPTSPSPSIEVPIPPPPPPSD